MIRRCVPNDEIKEILHHLHGMHVGGHFGASRIAAKVLECGFFWPTLFKDCKE